MQGGGARSAAAAGKRGRMAVGLGRIEAEAGVGLLAAAGAFIENGAVDFGDDDVVAAAEVVCVGG